MKIAQARRLEAQSNRRARRVLNEFLLRKGKLVVGHSERSEESSGNATRPRFFAAPQNDEMSETDQNPLRSKAGRRVGAGRCCLIEIRGRTFVERDDPLFQEKESCMSFRCRIVVLAVASLFSAATGAAFAGTPYTLTDLGVTAGGETRLCRRLQRTTGGCHGRWLVLDPDQPGR